MLAVFTCTFCGTYESPWLFAFTNHIRKCQQTPSQFACRNMLESYTCGKCNFDTLLKVDCHNHIKLEEHCGIIDQKKRVEYKCDRCNFITFSEYFHEVHKSSLDCWTTITDEGALKCEACDGITKTGSDMISHLISKHPDFGSTLPILQCPYCPYTVRRRKDLKEHLITEHWDLYHVEQLQCQDCPYLAKSRKLLKRHFFQNHVNKQFACDQCSFKTMLKRSLNQHIRRIHSQPLCIYECDYCRFKSKYADTITKHTLTVHFVTSKPGWLLCKKCTFETKEQSEMKKHINQCHVALHKCEYCSYVSGESRYMKTHIIVKHMDPSQIQWVSCDLCSEKFKVKQFLAKHMQRVHPTKEEYKCEQCDYKSKCKKSYGRHVKGHELEKIGYVSCTLCSKKLKNKKCLNHHIRFIHGSSEKIKWYKCGQCDFVTKYSGSYRDHMTIHDPAKILHTCDDCSYETFNKFTLARHRLANHSNECLKCEYCDYEARNKRGLARHCRNKHSPDDVKLYDCTHCTHKFKSEANLKRHLERLCKENGD